MYLVANKHAYVRLSMLNWHCSTYSVILQDSSSWNCLCVHGIGRLFFCGKIAKTRKKIRFLAYVTWLRTYLANQPSFFSRNSHKIYENSAKTQNFKFFKCPSRELNLCLAKFSWLHNKKACIYGLVLQCKWREYKEIVCRKNMVKM